MVYELEFILTRFLKLDTSGTLHDWIERIRKACIPEGTIKEIKQFLQCDNVFTWLSEVETMARYSNLLSALPIDQNGVLWIYSDFQKHRPPLENNYIRYWELLEYLNLQHSMNTYHEISLALNICNQEGLRRRIFDLFNKYCLDFHTQLEYYAEEILYRKLTKYYEDKTRIPFCEYYLYSTTRSEKSEIRNIAGILNEVQFERFVNGFDKKRVNTSHCFNGYRSSKLIRLSLDESDITVIKKYADPITMEEFGKICYSDRCQMKYILHLKLGGAVESNNLSDMICWLYQRGLDQPSKQILSPTEQLEDQYAKKVQPSKQILSPMEQLEDQYTKKVQQVKEEADQKIRQLTQELQQEKEKILLEANSRKSIPKILKEQVWGKYIGDKLRSQCLVCQKKEITAFDFEAGHVISRKEGGPTTIENLRPICRLCNSSMGTERMYIFCQNHFPMAPVLATF